MKQQTQRKLLQKHFIRIFYLKIKNKIYKQGIQLHSVFRGNDVISIFSIKHQRHTTETTTTSATEHTLILGDNVCEAGLSSSDLKTEEPE